MSKRPTSSLTGREGVAVPGRTGHQRRSEAIPSSWPVGVVDTWTSAGWGSSAFRHFAYGGLAGSPESTQGEAYRVRSGNRLSPSFVVVVDGREGLLRGGERVC